MTREQFEEGLAYAEDNFKNDQASHLKVDKQLIKDNFDLDGKKVLDFGCGMGGMSLWYAENWDCEVYALDIDGHHIEVAQSLQKKHNINNVRFHKRNILDTPLMEDEKFDIVILNDVAEHIAFPILKPILKQLGAHLTTEGGIFVSYPPWRSPYASHVTHTVKIPWCQFLPEKMLMRLIEKNNQVIVGELESDLVEAYKGLNHLTHKKLMNIAKSVGLQAVYRKSHSILNRFGPLKNTNINFFPFDFIVTKEFLMLTNDANVNPMKSKQKSNEALAAKI